MTVIVETMADSSCLSRNLSYFNLTFSTGGGLPGPGMLLHVWTSTQDALFIEQAPITIGADSSFTILVAPDSLVTLSTIANATKGGFPDSPVPAEVCLRGLGVYHRVSYCASHTQTPWALPYNDSFDGYADDAMARYFADQAGSWAVRNGTLKQVCARRDPN